MAFAKPDDKSEAKKLPPMNGPPLARNVSESARALGISRAGIYRLAASGKVKITRIGGRSVIAESELQRLASEGATLGGEQAA